jgi:CMP/dCMP kinase
MIILVCGFTASGKSQVARYLAKKLNFKFIHTSHILKQIANDKDINYEKTKSNNGWYEKSGLDNVRSKNLTIDQRLDKYLLKILKTEKNIVLDSWTMPFLFKRKKDVVRIWLDATKKERLRRQMIRNNISLNLAKKLLKEKDEFNINHFKKLYGFTLGKDLDGFDYILDTTKIEKKEVFKKCLIFVKEKIKN